MWAGANCPLGISCSSRGGRTSPGSSRGRANSVPMIDVYAPAGTFRDRATLVRDLATAVMTIERVPNIPLFRQNTAAFVHELTLETLSNVDGDHACVRVQVLTNAGGLDREKQFALVAELTRIVGAAAGDPAVTERSLVLLTDAPHGGRGLPRPAHTHAQLVSRAPAH